MSNYGSIIRWLISTTRRARSPDESGDYDSDESSQSRGTESRRTRKESWFNTRRPRSKKRSSAPITISRFQNVSRSRLLQLPDETPRSSTLSLCSCEQHDSHRSAEVGKSTHCSINSTNFGSELSLQISSVTSVEPDDFSTSFKSKDKHTRFMRRQSDPSRSRLNLVEALSLSPENKDDDSRGKSGYDEGSIVTHLPDTPKQVAGEGDDTYEALGELLSKIDTSRTSFNETPKLPPTTIIRRKSSRRATRRPNLTKKYRLSRNSAPISPSNSIKRNPSTKQIKRKKSVKQRQMKTQRKSFGAKNAIKNNAKWAENVTDLLSGKLFHKIEADEMLTPAQLEAYKLRRLSKLQLQQGVNSSETSLSVDSETVETPVEPFHMDDLPSRIGSSGVQLTVSTLVQDSVQAKTDPKSVTEVVKKDCSVGRDGNDDEMSMRGTQPTPSATSSGKDPPTKDEMSGQQSQLKSPSRYVFRKIPELPTISENAYDELFHSHGANRVVNGTADADYMFFRSTPYTMTAHSYCHGPIRLAKADLCPDPKLGADENLDWTAFQMAILGGAGDYLAESEHMARQQETEDAKGICEWWDDWGLDGYGVLVTRDDEPKSPSVPSEPNELLYHEIGKDNPYSARHKWKSLRRKARAEGRRLELDLRKVEKLYNGGGIRKWNANEAASRFSHRESMVSMPQSPMLDLTVITSDNGDVDYVPMGYNLSHDLGDFLSWENENVYSGTYDGGVI